MNYTNFNTYFKSANRGDFQWSPIDIDDWTGQILSEECTYKGQGVNVVVSGCKGNFTIEIDHLIYKPYSLQLMLFLLSDDIQLWCIQLL